MEVCPSVFLLGKPTCEISEVDMAASSAVRFRDFRNTKRYTRMQIHDIKFYGSDWNSKYGNATIAYYQGNEIRYGIIKLLKAFSMSPQSRNQFFIYTH